MMHMLATVELPPPFRTPLVRSGDLAIKVEGEQRTRSAKYRLVYSILQNAIRCGAIRGGTTLTEVTSGSTGVALAWLGRRLGLPVEIHAYGSISAAKREAIEALGADLVLHPPGLPMSELLEMVRRKVAGGGFWHLDQYSRLSGREAYRPLGREILEQISEAGNAPPKILVCPVGTGGLIQGVGACLRAALPSVRVIALEPEDSAEIDGVRNTRLFHLGELDPYDRTFPDETVRVPRPAERVSLGSTILGESASAAVQLARSLGWRDVVVVAPD
jgi:cysteine synthase